MKIILKQKGIKYFSMFSGIGGFEYGINHAVLRNPHKDIRKSTGAGRDSVGRIEQLSGCGNKGLSCIGYSEIDRYAIEVYEKHFKEKNYGDCSKIDWSKVPAFDFFVGGFPCQAFSIAGKRGGFEDTRGTLFFEIVRALRAKRPSHILLENVKGLLSHERGQTYRIIKDSLEELGYFVERQTLNSANFGVPQNRERVFIVGHLRERCRQQIFPLPEDGSIFKRQSSAKQRLAQAQISRAVKNEKVRAEDTFIKSNEDLKIRRLTPVECERLQGFPDGWTEGLSDGQRYKCLGNAVTTNVVEAVVFQMLKKGCLK